PSLRSPLFPYTTLFRSDEHPLRPRDLRPLRRVFPGLSVRGFQLLSMVRRVLRPGRLTASLEWLDERLLIRFPALQRYCRYVVLRSEEHTSELQSRFDLV